MCIRDRLEDFFSSRWDRLAWRRRSLPVQMCIRDRFPLQYSADKAGLRPGPEVVRRADLLAFFGRVAKDAADLEEAESAGLALGIEAGSVEQAREEGSAEQTLSLVERVLEGERLGRACLLYTSRCV